MATCSFFGHGDTPEYISQLLKETIIDSIENKDVTSFYVGNHGKFDYMVRACLKLLKAVYPHIRYSVVLAYLPKENKEFDISDYSDTIYPDGIENAPLKFAIDWRNRWMIEKSDYVITYVTRTVGGAYKYKDLSIKKNKVVIELSEFGK